MIKKGIAVIMSACFSLTAFMAVPVLAGHRIQNTGKATISLESRRLTGIPEQAGGTARFTLEKRANGAHKLVLNLSVTDLPERSRKVYEVWLLNGDGSSLNLTAFNTNNDGDAKVKVTRNIVNVAPYDRIVVSEKRRDSFSTSRSGRTVLSGVLHRGDSSGDFDEDFDEGSDEDFGDDFEDDDFGDDFEDDDFDDDFNRDTSDTTNDDFR